ncbi:MAG: serine O-acetyltransferase EpsC [Pseudomonadota bacterium]
MAVETFDSELSANVSEKGSRFYKRIPSIVQRLLKSCNSDGAFGRVDHTPLPSQESVIRMIYQARKILFPRYFTKSRLDLINLEYCLGKETAELFERLSKQIVLSIQHECLQDDHPCSRCIERGQETSLQFIQILPDLRTVLATDIRAALAGDPAAKSYDEIIFSYPGLFAIIVYRMAHQLFELDVPFLPRMMTEYAHSLTGIDIHPGAKIGESFFIDHGTGVVVGETTEIGNRVRLYQGVTLGALSIPRDKVDHFRGKKRHPTIEDDVVVYSNATILGAEAVIGTRSIIGGNVWITGPVPPDTKVLLKRPELVYIGNHGSDIKSKQRMKK